MKHLVQSTLYGSKVRRFNESKQNNLRDFCEANFAYLLDDGYEIQYKKMRAMYYSPSLLDKTMPGGTFVNGPFITISLQKEVGYFRWSEVKDYYLSFLERLQNNYELAPMQKYSRGEKKVTNYIKVLTQKNKRNETGLPGTDYEYYNIDEIEQADLDIVWSITIMIKL